MPFPSFTIKACGGHLPLIEPAARGALTIRQYEEIAANLDSAYPGISNQLCEAQLQGYDFGLSNVRSVELMARIAIKYKEGFQSSNRPAFAQGYQDSRT
jgi:flagellin-specific chaperone FliS